MDENHYLLQYMVHERLREAERRGAFESALRAARGIEATRGDSWSRRLGLWWSRRRGAARVPFASQADGSVLG